MKICPVCRSSRSDSLEFCPDDRTELIRYDLRSELLSRRSNSSLAGITFLPISFEPLPMRLRRELLVAGSEFRRDPRGFLKGMLPSDLDPRYRHSLAVSGAIVVTGLSTCFSLVLLVIGLLRPASAGARVEEKPRVQDGPHYVVIPLLSQPLISGRESNRRSGATGGSLPKPQRSAGGGGGGQQMQEPAERGTTAQAALQPPVLPPSPVAPKIANPSLIVPETVFADPRSLPPLTIDVGDPRGKEGTRSGGPGVGGGIGTGNVGGIGPNDGPGFGPGRLGNVGNNAFTIGGGPRRGNGEDEIPWANSRLSPTIVYKEKARYTEQARQNQIQGTVILRATFSADGRITDIRVIRGLPDGLTENAILAAQRIRFQPALRNGIPITVHASLEFNFALY